MRGAPHDYGAYRLRTNRMFIKKTMVILNKNDYNKIVDYALTELPCEACGLLAGFVDEKNETYVKKVYLLTNIDKSSEHFSLDPKEHLKAVKDMRELGFVPLGNWHSHPESPARPSDEDKRLAFDKTAVYMILSLQNKDAPVLKAFRINGSDSQEENVKII